jgi:hypothetical protein
MPAHCHGAVAGVQSSVQEGLMKIYIDTERSDRRLLWIAVAIVTLVLAWNFGTSYRW